MSSITFNSSHKPNESSSSNMTFHDYHSSSSDIYDCSSNVRTSSSSNDVSNVVPNKLSLNHVPSTFNTDCNVSETSSPPPTFHESHSSSSSSGLNGCNSSNMRASSSTNNVSNVVQNKLSINQSPSTLNPSKPLYGQSNNSQMKLNSIETSTWRPVSYVYSKGETNNNDGNFFS